MQSPTPRELTCTYELRALKVPLAHPGRLDAVTQKIYEILGLETAVLILPECGENSYTVLARHLVMARNAIRADALPEPGPDRKPLASCYTEEPFSAISVPVCQPRVSPDAAEAYQALGIDLATIEANGAQYSVPADAATEAYEFLSWGDLQNGNGPSASAPRRTYLSPSLTLKTRYSGEPSFVTRRLASLANIQFIRVLDGAAGVHWIPLAHPHLGIENVSKFEGMRLGLYA